MTSEMVVRIQRSRARCLGWAEGAAALPRPSERTGGALFDLAQEKRRCTVCAEWWDFT